MLVQDVKKNVIPNTTTVRLYVDSIKKLPKHRVRLEKYHDGVWYSFVIHSSVLKNDVDAVAIYRGKGYLTVSSTIAKILLGLNIDTKYTGAHKNVVKVTKHGPSTSLFDTPRSVILKIVEHNAQAF